MSANLSIIREDPIVVKTKEVGNASVGDASNDSGINSSASSNDSANTQAGTQEKFKNIIIPFQALNGVGDDVRKESTFVANNVVGSSCDISNIDGSNAHKITIDSDGQLPENRTFTT